MKRYFWRIFVVIWLGAALTGASVTLVDAVANPPARLEQQHHLVVDAMRLEATAVMKDASLGHRVDRELQEFRDRTGAAIYLFGDDGRVHAPKTPPDHIRELAARVRAEGDIEERRDNGTLVGVRVPELPYVAVGRVRRTPTWARALGEEDAWVRITMLLVASGLLAFLLALYLVRPVRHLQDATARIAEGDLGARVKPELGTGLLSDLGADFDVMAERVEELLEERQQLLSDVSHELNSPLARLNVALELARKKAGPDAEGALDRIGREADRLAQLVDEILTFARLERAEVRRESVDLTALVSDVVRDASFEAGEQAVALGRRDTVELSGDGEVLRRAVDNVVRNALRFSPTGEVVHVDVERHDAEVRVRVRDRGPGVPDEELAAIFEPLYRVERDRARASGGAGLGLAIAQRAVAAHGGEITAKNSPEGGLVVTLVLPLG